MVSPTIPKNGLSIVIDTNVLVSALRSRQGSAYRLLRHLGDGSYRPCVSVPLFIEYEAVLKRTGLLPHLNTKDVDVLLDYFLSEAQIAQIFFLWRPFLKDPKDDLVLEAAVASKSDYIVTFNERDFSGTEKYFGINVVTPQIFLKEQGLL